jgi:hypothetical protein
VSSSFDLSVFTQREVNAADQLFILNELWVTFLVAVAYASIALALFFAVIALGVAIEISLESNLHVSLLKEGFEVCGLTYYQTVLASPYQHVSH